MDQRTHGIPIKTRCAIANWNRKRSRTNFFTGQRAAFSGKRHDNVLEKFQSRFYFHLDGGIN